MASWDHKDLKSKQETYLKVYLHSKVFTNQGKKPIGHITSSAKQGEEVSIILTHEYILILDEIQFFLAGENLYAGDAIHPLKGEIEPKETIKIVTWNNNGVSINTGIETIKWMSGKSPIYTVSPIGVSIQTPTPNNYWTIRHNKETKWLDVYTSIGWIPLIDEELLEQRILDKAISKINKMTLCKIESSESRFDLIGKDYKRIKNELSPELKAQVKLETANVLDQLKKGIMLKEDKNGNNEGLSDT